MANKFNISTHPSGYYQVSIPNYKGGDVVAAEDYDKLERMLATVIDANYGTSYHDIGGGDGIPESDAEEIRQWWMSRLKKIVEDWSVSKAEASTK